MKKLPIGSALAAMALAAAPVAEGAVQMAQAPDVAELSLEQLASITVTTASRRAEPLLAAPASIFVISAEDIRRSGATSIPEALRLAPNLQVARADNNQYAISARGFNNVLANKMLVLIDGRTVYSPLFSGVFWEAQDTFLEDVDRIEVISGPAATLWGANGVNGVINIITRSASATRGTLAYAGAGTRESGVGARVSGDAFGNGAWRAYAKYVDRQHLDLDTGAVIRDQSRRIGAGMRSDWIRPADTVTVQGDAYSSVIDQAPSARSISGGNVLARWTRVLHDGGALQLQGYYDRTSRDHPGTFKEALDTLDFELQHNLGFIAGHRVVWGAGYRSARDHVENTAAQAFIPADRTLHWANVFVQDEFALGAALEFTLGMKLETNIYTGKEYLPNARLAWTPAKDHLVWAALSRAVRAPSRIDRDVFFPGTAPFTIVGNTTFESEIARVAELGYRAQLGPALSFSTTAFYEDFPNLRSLAITPAGVVFANGIEGRSHGVEGWGMWRATSEWRLSAGFVAMRERFTLQPGQLDTGILGNDPSHTASVRSSWNLTPRHELDLAVRHVGELKSPAVPAYTVVDARFGWRPTDNVELSLTVQNALDRNYSEWGVAGNRAVLERAVFLKAVLRL